MLYWRQNEAHITRTHDVTMKVSKITTQNNKRKMIQAMIDSDYSVSKACKIVGIYPSTHYRWRKDEKYVAESKLAFDREEKRQDRLYKIRLAKFFEDSDECFHYIWKS